MVHRDRAPGRARCHTIEPVPPGAGETAHRTSGRWRLGVALSLGAVLMWGLLPIGLKALLRQLDPLTITWYRFLGSAVVLAIPVIRSRGLAPVRGFSRRRLTFLAIAALGLSANYILYVLGLDFVSPSAAQVIIQLAPMFMLLGGMVVFGERFTPWQWAGLAVLVLGQGLFFNEELLGLFGGLTPLGRGLLFMLGAALAWAAYALAQKQLLNSLSSTSIMFVIYLVGALVYLVPATPSRILALDGTGLVLLAFLTFNTLAAYGCFAEALDHLEASRVSVILALTPLVTVASVAIGSRLFPQVVDPEGLGPVSMAGAVLVVAGSVLAALARRNGRRAASGREVEARPTGSALTAGTTGDSVTREKP